MGVKLDWDIEAEKGKQKEHREDKIERKSRYLGVLRLLLVVAVFAGLIGAVIYLIQQRLEQVNQELEQLLIDTVQAEVTALRLGDLTAFEALQRSASEDWLITQRQTYDAYQSLKMTSSLTLSGRVIDVETDDQRGRVQVEEIIDGAPYVQTWFYWRYEEGWFHVPPDYTFWGEPAEITRETHTIRYRGLDESLAQALDQTLVRWREESCTYLDCASVPRITVDLIPEPQAPVRWQDTAPDVWQLIVPSPYTARARADQPFMVSLQVDVAAQLAERLVSQVTGNLDPLTGSDADFLQESVTAWFVGRFVQINPETHLLQSLIDQHGADSLTRLLQNLQSVSDMSLLATITDSASLADLDLDWRDFVLWRLQLEDDLIVRGDQAGWEALYDFSRTDVRDIAYQRYLNSFIANERTVLSTSLATSDSGVPQLVARVNVTRGFESGEEVVVFNLINGNWLRAN
ncbi:MAG: hypothetical protein ACFE0Q_06285 [Anaerolineae bacterium]